ncbi:MAG TPA: MAPEG family protein [Gammaproteobacteria bacterium]|nr:MAPEG family protein [Gammaproteobacteria bacterium]
MHQETILYPLLAMALLTGWVGVRMLQLRFRAVRRDGLSPAYFELNRGARPPEYLLRIEQHYQNLLESPLLFYVGLVLIYVTGQADAIALALGWLYVAARLAHLVVHVGAMGLTWRRRTFLTSIVLLYALWVRLFVQLAAS